MQFISIAEAKWIGNLERSACTYQRGMSERFRRTNHFASGIFIIFNQSDPLKKRRMNWTLDDFKAYLLLCSAHADFGESSEEHQFIRSKVNTDTLASITEEFQNDSDFQRIEKLKEAAKQLALTSGQLDELVGEMTSLFKTDGTFDQMEKSFLMMTKHIIS